MVDAVAVEQAAAEVRTRLNLRMHFFQNRQVRKALVGDGLAGGTTLALASPEVAEVLRARRKNALARGRSETLRSLGMKRTPYGWE